MRLAFSVAIHADPDILLVDEALAVGDVIFQHRCINRINQLRKAGKTILFVTHDFAGRHEVLRPRDPAGCTGKSSRTGRPEHVVQRYQALIFERERRAAGKGEFWGPVDQDTGLQIVNTIPYIHNRFGEGRAEILGIILLSKRRRGAQRDAGKPGGSAGHLGSRSPGDREPDHRLHGS